MRKYFPTRLKEIHDQVKKMDYSPDNMMDIVLLFKESIKITKRISSHVSKNQCLQFLNNIKDSEYLTLISKEIDNEEDRERAFKEFKFVFLRDLEDYCM